MVRDEQSLQRPFTPIITRQQGLGSGLAGAGGLFGRGPTQPWLSLGHILKLERIPLWGPGKCGEGGGCVARVMKGLCTHINKKQQKPNLNPNHNPNLTNANGVDSARLLPPQTGL